MEDKEETFISHLVELRDRLIRALVAVGVVFLALVNWARDIYSLLAAPMLAALPQGGHMIATDVAGAFFVPMKVTMMVAFLIALPYVLYQAWAFVAPGLYQHEKRLALPLLVASVVLFFIGMGFAYFIVFPTVFAFINAFAPEGVAVMTDIDKYLSFVLTTFLAFGVTFEVPVAVIVLVRVGLVSIEKLKEIRPYVIVGCFVVGAIFTPPDVLSQIMLAVPMWLLYELGIVMARVIGKPAEDDETPSQAPAARRPLDDAAMNAELDKAEAESAANRQRQS
jgi:sec-independent protein translocase protein TatC